MGFMITLTNTTAGNFTSILTYTPTGMLHRPAELMASCDDPRNIGHVQTENISITLAGIVIKDIIGKIFIAVYVCQPAPFIALAVPAAPQVAAPIVSCDLVSGSYQAMLQWSGDTSHTHYQVEVTSPAGFVCPPEQCNITTTITTITGLRCATNYSLTVRAVNCAGQGNTTTITLPVEGDIIRQLYTIFSSD